VTFTYTGKYKVYDHEMEATKIFDSLEEAKAFVERRVGNNRFAKPFDSEETYLYGPGNGDTTYMIRPEVEFGKKEDSDAYHGGTSHKV
jgi:hypothetical protein